MGIDYYIDKELCFNSISDSRRGVVTPRFLPHRVTTEIPPRLSRGGRYILKGKAGVDHLKGMTLRRFGCICRRDWV